MLEAPRLGLQLLQIMLEPLDHEMLLVGLQGDEVLAVSRTTDNEVAVLVRYLEELVSVRLTTMP